MRRAIFFGALIALPAFAFDLAALQKLVADGNLRSVDAVIEKLPAELFSSGNFVLIKDPQGVLGGSPQFPRVIHFGGKDTELIVSYASDPKAAGASSLELMTLDRAQGRFEPAQVQFDPAGRAAPVWHIGARDAANKECLQCHRPDFRPNWDSYPTWRTAYGSGLVGEDADKERAQLRDLIAHLGERDRLKRFSESSLADVEGTNTQFSLTLTFVNFRRIARLLRASPDYQHYKYALWASLFGCDDIPGFLPESRRPAGVDYAALEKDTLSRILGSDTREQRFPNVESVARVASLRYLLEPRGLSIESWSMTFEPGTYRVQNDFELNAILDVLRAELPPGSFDEGQWFGYMGSFSVPRANETTCPLLKERSLAALAR